MKDLDTVFAEINEKLALLPGLFEGISDLETLVALERRRMEARMNAHQATETVCSRMPGTDIYRPMR